MWSRALNLIYLQVFLFHSLAYGVPSHTLSTSELYKASKVIQELNYQELQKVYLNLRPLIHKDDAETIDFHFFEKTLKSIIVTDKGLYLKSGDEEAYVTKIDMINLSASFNGKTLNLRKSVAQNLYELYPENKSTSSLDMFISPVFAQSTAAEKAPGKLKLLALLVAGAIVAVITAGSVAFGWLKINKNTKEDTIHEIQAPGVEQVFRDDCHASKQELKKSGLGERGSEVIRKVRMNIKMLSDTQTEALKMKQEQRMGWIQEVKNCYGEVLSMAEKSHPAIKDDSSRTIKEVPKSPANKTQTKKASGQ
jgi:hypothetical protein